MIGEKQKGAKGMLYKKKQKQKTTYLIFLNFHDFSLQYQNKCRLGKILMRTQHKFVTCVLASVCEVT